MPEDVSQYAAVSRVGKQKLSTELTSQIDRGETSSAVDLNELKEALEQERLKSGELAATNLRLESEIHNLRASADILKSRNKELEGAYYDTVVRLTRASEYKDPESGAHIIRMGHYAEILAVRLDLGERFARLIHSAAPMHDVGKIGVPDAVLLKEGPLNDVEWEMMKRHPRIGARLLEGSKSPLLEMARQIALTHHERWDGSGYPAGLEGEDIPIAGHIVMLADHYDALRSERPYKESMSHLEACDVFFNGDVRTRPEHFDPKLLTVFREVQDQFEGIFTVFGD